MTPNHGHRPHQRHHRTFSSDQGAQTFARLLKQLGAVEADKIMEARAGTGPTEWTTESWLHHHIDLLTGVQEDTLKRYRRIADTKLGPLAKLPIEAVARSAGASVAEAHPIR